MERGAGGYGYQGSRRHYTLGLSFGKRPLTRETALPNILWRASGVRARPTSGLKPVVTNVPNAGAHPHLPTTPRERSASIVSTLSDSTALGRPFSRRLTARTSAENYRLQPRPHAKLGTPASPPTPRTFLPPLTLGGPAEGAVEERENIPEARDKVETSSSTEEEEELYSDEEEEEEMEEAEEQGSPSQPSFEPQTQTMDIPFPAPSPSSSPSSSFPATLIQEHAMLELEQLAATVQPSGLTPRANNVVRAFSIHGPLDRDLLAQALNTVANLHPILGARFLWHKESLFVQVPEGRLSVDLESPAVGHEKSEVLIVNARRRLIAAPFSSDPLCVDAEEEGVREKGKEEGRKAEGGKVEGGKEEGGKEEGGRKMSVLSVVSSKEGEESKERLTQKPKMTLPSLSKKSVTFLDAPSTKLEEQASSKPRFLPSLSSSSMTRKTLMRTRLVRRSIQEAVLVLSFSRLICDFWSSCLFVRQLVDVYTGLERSSTQRISLAGRRMEGRRGEGARREGRRRELVGRSGRETAASLVGFRGVRGITASERQARPVARVGNGAHNFTSAVPAKVSFRQVALRERELLKHLSKERLWTFWHDMLTATIHRQKGRHSRFKIVPPVRIPSGLGQKIAPSVRPQTSRLRPFTGRNRPQMGRRVAGDGGPEWATLAGPRTEFHFIKVEEEVCAALLSSFPDEQLPQEEERGELLCLSCLAGYVLLLGRCCRGWGGGRGGGGGEGGDELTTAREKAECGKMETIPFNAHPEPITDPLQQYKRGQSLRETKAVVHVPSAAASVEVNNKTVTANGTDRIDGKVVGGGRRGRLDVGSFLVGVELSLRQSHSRTVQGLFGPLTNDVGIRVNLSSCETFVDLVQSLGKSLQSARYHYHFPFSTVADELRVPPNLPVRFSFLHRSDIVQLTDPTQFYFTETAVGVKGHGLAKFGSNSYLTPLCTKTDDSCHLELLLWEGEGGGVGGVFLYQPRVLRKDLVEGLQKELCHLLATIAMDPAQPLAELTSSISPPFTFSTHPRARKTATTTQ